MSNRTIVLPRIVRIEVTEKKSIFHRDHLYILRFVDNKLVGEGWVGKGDTIILDLTLEMD